MLIACEANKGTQSTTEGGTRSAAPSSATDVQFPLTIKDAGGREHVFDEPVTRFGAFWWGSLEVLADLGIPPRAGLIPFDSLFLYPNGPVEIVISRWEAIEEWAQADVEVIGVRLPVSDDLTALETAAPIFYLHAPQYTDASLVGSPSDSLAGIEAYKENIRLTGRITDRMEEAQRAIKRFDQVVANLQSIAPEGASELRFVSQRSTNDQSYKIVTDSNPLCDVLETYGLGKCVGGMEKEVNAEWFLNLDPQWIMYGNKNDKPESEGWQLRDDPVWNRLSAVRNGRIFNTSYGGYCCSLRGLEHVLVDYAHYVFDQNIPPAGPFHDFNPNESPLLDLHKK